MQDQCPPSDTSAVPVAEYVRMSTEHQQYSLQNQSEAIGRYAHDCNMRVVRTYVDSGKTGLTLHHREGLQKLIEDVESGHADFSAILVYDVSRWGRFQDVDESAYYEYRCKRAKIAVHYCVEMFKNDGSLSSSLLKTIKRTMAGEYSRELSAKVFAGKARLIEKGFRQGGSAGYGLRRLLIDEKGNPKTILRRGQRKSIFTDRVILIPGPAEEIGVVRDIYRLCTQELLSSATIAQKLNELGLPTEFGGPWTRHIVHEILTNLKYIGTNVTNRHSCKLRGRDVRNPPEMWVRRENAFAPLISVEMFQKAQDVAAQRSKRYTDEELLDALRLLQQRTGGISVSLLKGSSDMPGSAIYQTRFGGFVEAYRRIGYKHPEVFWSTELGKQLRSRHREFAKMLIEELRSTGAGVELGPRPGLVTVNGEFTILFTLARCQTDDLRTRWKLRLNSRLKPDITVVGRMAPGNECILDYYFVPGTDKWESCLTIEPDNGFVVDAYRFTDLSILKNLARRTNVSSPEKATVKEHL
jgi:DNA invertase Pin-like site-specific DNA recombinase